MDLVGASLGLGHWEGLALWRRAAEQVSPADRARFVEVVETELMGLHEGNIARYRLPPAEYQTWRQGWR